MNFALRSPLRNLSGLQYNIYYIDKKENVWKFINYLWVLPIDFKEIFTYFYPILAHSSSCYPSSSAGIPSLHVPLVIDCKAKRVCFSPLRKSELYFRTKTYWDGWLQFFTNSSLSSCVFLKASFSTSHALHLIFRSFVPILLTFRLVVFLISPSIQWSILCEKKVYQKVNKQRRDIVRSIR